MRYETEFATLKDEVLGRLKEADAAETVSESDARSLDPAIVPAFGPGARAGRAF